MKIMNGRVVACIYGCAVIAVAGAVREARGQRSFGGQYPPTWNTNVMDVGSGDGQVAVDRNFTGKFVGPDQLPYTGDDTDISAEVIDYGAGGAIGQLPGNSGYGSMGIDYPEPYFSNGLVPPPPGGSLSGLTLTATGTPLTSPVNLNTPFGDQPAEHVYHGYTTFTGLFGDDNWLWADNGRLWDGRVAQWEHITVCYLTGIDMSLFNLDPTVTTDIATPPTEFSLEEWVTGMYELTIEPGEESQCNTGLYNNGRANQHSQGHPRYYFEVTNVDRRSDEHRGHEYTFTHTSATKDLPGPPASAGEYSVSARVNPNTTDAIIDESWVKGFLIPVAALPDLQTGDLGDQAWYEAAFPNHPYPAGMDLNGDGDIDDAGEQPFDLAVYMRDIIYGQLLDTDKDLSNGQDYHPNLFSGDTTLAHPNGLGSLQRNHFDPNPFGPPAPIEYVQLIHAQAPIAVVPGTGSERTADLYGVQTGDMATYTSINVTDLAVIDIIEGAFGPPGRPSLTPKYGVPFNTIALETFAAVSGDPGIDWNPDGELKNGMSLSQNVWDLFTDNVGNPNDGVVAELARTTSDSQTYLGLGGRQKDAGDSRCAPGEPADPDRVWCLSDGPAYAEAVVRLQFDNPWQVMHLILERDNAPVAWAIIVDGRKPILGVGGATITDDACGDVYGGVDVTTTTCCQANVGGNCVLNSNADYTCYLLSVNDCTKTVKLWMGPGDGTDNLLATYNYAGSGCSLPTCVDGMRIFATGLEAITVPDPLLCTDVEPADTNKDFLERMDVDLISWGYDPFAMPSLQLEAVCRSLVGDPIAPANAEDYVWPVSEQDGNAAGGLTSVDIQLSSDVALIQTGSCVTTQSGGGPTSATIAPLGPVGAYRVTLDAPIPLGEWTTVTIAVQDAESACNQDATICFHLGWQPGDTNGDGQTNLNDATSFGQQFALGINAALKRADLNVDGQVNLNDATRFGNIWNGSSGEQAWLGTGLGAKPGCNCP